MKISLSEEKKQELELKHRKEKNSRNADRIKSILLYDEGWDFKKISQALRIHKDTAYGYISDYIHSENLQFKYQGSKEKLTEDQAKQLIAYLEENLYTKVLEIINYVKITFNITYTVSGMTDWLKKHNFSYKSPKGSPSKADIQKQHEFDEIYAQLKEKSEKNKEPIMFLDAVHPSMQTKLSYGWIRKGKDKEVPTTASRTKVNIMGAVDLDQMTAVTKECEKNITGDAIINFFDEIKKQYPLKNVIHLILDQAGYNKASNVREYASKIGIHLHYLPAYSPNLNAIERLWKVMNEEIRNNVFFKTAKEFKEKIRWFFDKRLPELLPTLRSRINDNFHIKAVN